MHKWHNGVVSTYNLNRIQNICLYIIIILRIYNSPCSQTLSSGWTQCGAIPECFENASSHGLLPLLVCIAPWYFDTGACWHRCVVTRLILELVTFWTRYNTNILSLLSRSLYKRSSYLVSTSVVYQPGAICWKLLCQLILQTNLWKQ